MRHARARVLHGPLLVALVLVAVLSLAGFLVARSIVAHDQSEAAGRRAAADRVRAEILLERAKSYVVGLTELLSGERNAGQPRFAFLAGTTISSFDLIDALWIAPTGPALLARYATTVAPGTDVSHWQALAGPIARSGTVFAATATTLGSLHGTPGFWLVQSGRFGQGTGTSGYLAVFVPRGWMTLSLQDDPHQVEVFLDGRHLEGSARGSAVATTGFSALGQAWRVRVAAPQPGSLEEVLPWVGLAWPWAAGVIVALVGNAVLRRRRAEHEAERIFDLSLDLLGVANDQGFFVHVNPAFTRTLGYTPAELTSRPFIDFVVPEDRARTREEFERLTRGEEVVQFENRYRCRDGSFCWLEWSVRPLAREGLLYAAARDVTARREAEEKVRQTELTLRASRDELRLLADELAASRARVVAAADTARRRIERDLHDGTQQRLVALSLALRLAEAQVPPEYADLRARISAVAEGLAGAVADLQELSRGIHPAILSRGGLGPALRALARRSSIPVDLDADITGRTDAAVEVAAYYLVSEALTNAAKHSGAAGIEVHAHASGPELQITIRDDGVGGADLARGSGLVGLLDRVAAVGGTLDIRSEPGQGTTLRAVFPISGNPEGGAPRAARERLGT